jgi:hypothetical protein
MNLYYMCEDFVLFLEEAVQLCIFFAFKLSNELLIFLRPHSLADLLVSATVFGHEKSLPNQIWTACLHQNYFIYNFTKKKKKVYG